MIRFAQSGDGLLRFPLSTRFAIWSAMVRVSTLPRAMMASSNVKFLHFVQRESGGYIQECSLTISLPKSDRARGGVKRIAINTN